MNHKQETSFRQHKIVAAVLAAMACATAMPAYSADAEVDALRQELAAQRKMIEQLLANQKAAPSSSPNSAEDVEKKLQAGGKQPLTAPANPPTPGTGTAIDTQLRFYGLADIALVEQNSGFGNKTRIDGSGGMQASRLGVQATRAFGNIKATAVAELGVQFDSGSTGGTAPALGVNDTAVSSSGAPGTGPQIFSRQIWAGIDAGFGQVSVGRQYTGSYIAVAVVGSAFGDGLYGNTGSFTPLLGGMPTRMNNSVIWATPKVAGFYGVFSATTGSENNVNSSTVLTPTTTTNDKAGRGLDLAAFYSGGPLQAAVSAWSVNNTSWVTAGETGLAKKTGYQLAANYDLGFVKLFGNFVSGKIAGGNYQNVTKTLSNATGYGVSALFPFGNHHVVVTYTDVNDKSLLNKDGKLYGLSYWYTLFQNTDLYASAGYMQNSANATYPLNDAANDVGNVTRPGFNPRGVMTGIKYRF